MHERRSLTLGLVLVAIGGFFLLRRYVQISGPAPILILIGALLVTLSAARGFRGPLLPGSILLGLGAAFWLAEGLEPWLPHWATLVLGIGCGFLLTAAVDQASGRDHAAPRFVPGAVLVALAAGAALSRQVSIARLFERFAGFWPWLLIAAGLTLVAGATRKTNRT